MARVTPWLPSARNHSELCLIAPTYVSLVRAYFGVTPTPLVFQRPADTVVAKAISSSSSDVRAARKRLLVVPDTLAILATQIMGKPTPKVNARQTQAITPQRVVTEVEQILRQSFCLG